MTNFDLGSLSGQIVSQNGFTVTPFARTDVFEFDLNNSGRQIGLNLHNLNGDADLRLFFDSNGNGFLDSGDQQVASSLNFGTANDVIDFDPTVSGTYFAEVSRFSGPFTLSYDLDLSSNYDLGTVDTTPVSRSGFSVSASDPEDVFEFDISGNRTIHLNLNNISSGDDIDLRLFRDNGNGVFDADDLQVASSINGSNRDDLIDVRATTGTYFAQVERFSGFGSATYDLDVSATFGRQSNLVGGEIELGTLNNDVTRFGQLNDNNTVDSYAFSLPSFSEVDITLSGLNSDVDIRLIQDGNNNGIVDAGEVIGSSIRGGTLVDSINNISAAGDYILQVHQFSSTSTGYTVNFDRSLSFGFFS